MDKKTGLHHSDRCQFCHDFGEKIKPYICYNCFKLAQQLFQDECGKLKHIGDAVESWKSGELSGYSAMVAINIILNGVRNPTQAEIEYGLQLENAAQQAVAGDAKSEVVSQQTGA